MLEFIKSRKGGDLFNYQDNILWVSKKTEKLIKSKKPEKNNPKKPN